MATTAPITTAAATPSYPAVTDAFKHMLHDTLKIDRAKALPFTKIGYIFSVLNESGNFVFSDADERLTNLLMMMACLLYKKGEKVCYISPTRDYAFQAAFMRNDILMGIQGSDQPGFSVVVPGMLEYEKVIKKSTVIFMHGKDFSDYLPERWQGRKIIQIFPGVTVPVDPSHHCPYHWSEY
jgi:hypothetical protein